MQERPRRPLNRGLPASQAGATTVRGRLVRPFAGAVDTGKYQNHLAVIYRQQFSLEVQELLPQGRLGLLISFLGQFVPELGSLEDGAIADDTTDDTTDETTDDTTDGDAAPSDTPE